MLISNSISFIQRIALILSCGLFVLTAANAQKIDAKSQMLYDALEGVNGGYKKLAKKKDVQFMYYYDDKAKGMDISMEKHIFDGEHSWAEYKQHPVNVLPDMKGTAVQSLVMNKPAVTLDGKKIMDEAALGGTVFLRKVNLYWFAMMYKLTDPGTISEYQGKKDFNGKTYDTVKLSYANGATGKPADDEYILYFNPETHLVDMFYFSLPALGINDPILRMECDYTKVDGILLSTTRRAYAPNKEGKYGQIGEYLTKDIKFKNKFSKEDFML